MMRALGLVSLTALAVSSPVYGAELMGGFVDMRLAYERVAIGYDGENNGAEVEDDFVVARRVSLDWVGSLGLRRWGGWLWGIGGSWNYNEGEFDDNSEFTLQSWVVRGQLGYGYAFTERLQIEALPFLGFGRAFLDTDLSTDDSSDSYWELGITGNLTYTFGNGFQVGGTTGIFHNDTSITEEVSGTTYDFEADTWKVGAFIGVRL